MITAVGIENTLDTAMSPAAWICGSMKTIPLAFAPV